MLVNNNQTNNNLTTKVKTRFKVISSIERIKYCKKNGGDEIRWQPTIHQYNFY